ncbi:MAG TPA: PilX N-terminal domain-containing pilus assembly protein [Steroidobacteraceae bacterium]
MRTTRFRLAERGAALVVGLVLLVILTLLAISGMNTATTELVMAGNEMYQENAFQAA